MNTPQVLHPQVLHPGHALWPARLADLRRPPTSLRVLGTLPALEGAIAIVGTRAADDDALEFAYALGAAAAALGRAVVSGGALGVDAAAHRGALAAGGATIAVLPTGFAPAYPRAHTELFAQIAARGALVTEQPDHLAPHRGTFLARNRIIAALAEQVVVVQAPLRSGALSTAAAARYLPRPVWAVPAAPWDVRGQGGLALLRQGARICTSPRDVLSLPALKPPAALEVAVDRGGNLGDFEGLDSSAQMILGALGKRGRHPDALSAQLGLPPQTVLTVLLELELSGRIERRPDGSYRTPRM